MKIKSKKHIKVTEDVYDITVPETHNFLLEAGVFTHNCDHPQTVIGGWCPENAGVTVPGSKDVSDAVTQIVYSAFTNPVQTNIMDVANAINKQMKSSITSQARPMYYNMPKRQMSEYDAMKKALALFNGQK